MITDDLPQQMNCLVAGLNAVVFYNGRGRGGKGNWILAN